MKGMVRWFKRQAVAVLSPPNPHMRTQKLTGSSSSAEGVHKLWFSRHAILKCDNLLIRVCYESNIKDGLIPLEFHGCSVDPIDTAASALDIWIGLGLEIGWNKLDLWLKLWLLNPVPEHLTWGGGGEVKFVREIYAELPQPKPQVIVPR